MIDGSKIALACPGGKAGFSASVSSNDDLVLGEDCGFEEAGRASLRGRLVFDSVSFSSCRLCEFGNASHLQAGEGKIKTSCLAAACF